MKRQRLISATNIHPKFEPTYIFNDSGETVTLKSALFTSPLAQNLFLANPGKYSLREPDDQKLIKLKPGGYAHLKHTFYTVHTDSGKPANLRYRPISDL